MFLPYTCVFSEHFGQMKRLLSALETDTHSSASKYAVIHSFFFGPSRLTSSGTFKKIQDWHGPPFHVWLTAGHRIEPIEAEVVGLLHLAVILDPLREFALRGLAARLELQVVLIKGILVEVVLLQRGGSPCTLPVLSRRLSRYLLR